MYRYILRYVAEKKEKFVTWRKNGPSFLLVDRKSAVRGPCD